MSTLAAKKRGGSNSRTTVAAASSSSRSETTSSETVYERQELETRTRRNAGAHASVNAEIEASGLQGLGGSPLSRSQEKDELKLLNSRLAAYIDLIRSQEQEISVLRRKVETINSTESQEAKKLTDTYGREIASLRRALDEIAKDLAGVTAERDQLRTESKDYLARNAALENEKSVLQRKLKDAESSARDARAQLSGLRDEVRDATDQLNAANARIRDLLAQIEQLKKELQSETIKRVDAENKLLSAQEELRFQRGLHEEQVATLRNQRVIEITEVEQRLGHEYNTRISDQLDQLRADMEIIATETREELERNYQNQMEDLQNLAERNAEDARHILEELRSTQNRLKEIQGKTDRQSQDYRAHITRLEADLRAKDADIQRLQQLLSDRQAELQKTHQELSDLMQLYQELLGEKIQLDAELATYHTLLRTEEERLNMKISPFPSTPGSARKGTKRRITTSDQVTRTRFRNEASAKGEIHVSEIDADGQFVRLENKSAQDILVAGWTLHMRSNNGSDNETRYRIHSQQVLKAHSTMTVWSANTNIVHEPPADIVMEGRWLVGDTTVVTLSNAEGEEVARREMTRSSQETGLVGEAGVLKRRRLVAQRGDYADGVDDQSKDLQFNLYATWWLRYSGPHQNQ